MTNWLKNKKKTILMLLSGFLFPLLVNAQLFTNPPVTGAPANYAQMIQALFGSGVVVTNLTINCDTTNRQMGWFVANGSNLNLTNGLLLTSGDIMGIGSGATGTNNSGGYTGAIPPLPGDADLDNIPGVLGTNDACGIEFDIVPYCDTISIQYVFGSEEYMEFVGSFNDIFAFFITGPNPAGGNYTNYNIARLPGTTTPVSINNVNCGTNATYYVCNEPFSTGCNAANNCPPNAANTTVQYDGITAVLEATAGVVSCQSYHIKIVVADDLDNALDSGVFLQAGGVQCSGGLVNVGVGNTVGVGGNVAVEGCVDGFFNFTIPQPSILGDTFNFIIGGTATPNVDYTGTVPSQVVIPPGQSSVNIPVQVIQDGIAEVTEFIEIIYIDSFLCSSQIVQDTFYLQILDAPVSDAGPDQTLCSGDTITVGAGSPPGYNYSWTPNAGLTDPTNPVTQLTLVNTTAAPVTYQYILDAEALLGVCGASDTAMITVSPTVTADFTATTVCQGLTTQFTNNSSASALSFIWDFGDNTPVSNIMNPAHVYAAGGTYNVQLISIPAIGCNDTIVVPVTVHPKPVADFSSTSVCFPLATALTDQTTVSPPTTWSWSLGDGTSDLTQNPVHNYTGSGNFSVQLYVNDANGCKDTVTKNVEVYEQVLTNFQTANVCYGTLAQFNDMSNSAATVYSWDFGDTFTSTQENPSHMYGNPGVYPVTLISESANGCKDTMSQQIVIYVKPIADFTIPNTCFGKVTQITDASAGGTGWNWNLGNGTTSSLQNPSLIYGTTGNQTVTLLLSSIEGCKDTAVKTVVIYENPAANFTALDGCVVNAVEFTFTGGNGTGTINSYSWNFGDAQIDVSQNPSHSYTNPGPYTVSLVVVDNLGCSDTLLKGITTYPMPQANFTVSNECEESLVSFVNNSTVSTGSIVQQSWSFGDNNSSSLLNPGHIYDNAGIFPVILTVTTEHNCINTFAAPVTIYPRPDVNFVSTKECVGDITFFTDLTTLGPIVADDFIAGWSWTLGDGTTSNIQNPSHLYANAGTYNANLTVTTDKGCDRSKTLGVSVYQLPQPPTVISDTVCAGEPISLYAISQAPAKTHWYYLPSDTLAFHIDNSLTIPNLIFDKQFYVQSVSYNGKCSSDKAPVFAGVHPVNSGEITVSNAVVELPLAVIDFGTNTVIPLSSYQWSFGDGTVSELPTPSHEYEYTGPFSVKLVSIDENGCKLTLNREVEVKELFGVHIPSVFTPNNDLSNDYLTVGTYNIATFDFQLYDRWGGLVFQSLDPNFSWDGKTNGNDLPEGVYVFKVKAVSVTNKLIEKTGSVTIIR
ncbi:MAG: choice-of-anchor L domain-containing protein [Bacteroidia bacterium]|nr:choice-of-anchor L domain-containing protein [Bacteroidia bacterium]